MPNYEKTFINPIALHNYPHGLRLDKEPAEQRPHIIEYREFADISVLWDDNKWYAFGSGGMVFWTEDYKNWYRHDAKLTTEEIGAPTIAKYKDKYYCTANGTKVYVADSPLGPYEPIGNFKLPNGESLIVADPMIFPDDDGRVYLYYGCGIGIHGVELDPNDLTQFLCEPKFFFAHNTKEHLWERMGADNEDGSFSWVEGGWMFKRGDTYYLTYTAPNTEFPTYAMGAYKSKSPMGPWEYMQTSPFITKRHGTFKGAGHGSIAKGPNDTVWTFYTGVIAYATFVERFVGMQPLGFDENGDIIPTVADDNPQWLPGVKENPHLDNNAGLVPMTHFRTYTVSSEAPGRTGIYALDESALSWWQPASDDKEPTLTVDTIIYKGKPEMMAYAARIAWRYVGMNVLQGKLPVPIKYKIEVLDLNDNWVCVLDKTNNTDDLYFDYQILKPTYAKKVRLVITDKGPFDIGVIDFSVYGKWEPSK